MRKYPILILCLLIVLSIAATAGASSEMPDIYQGVVTLTTTGERGWTVQEAGECGNWEDHYKEFIKESAEIQVQAMYIMAGVIADTNRPSIAKAAVRYELHKNGQLIEYWDFPLQTVTPMIPQDPLAYCAAIPIMSIYSVGMHLTVKAEHGVYDETDKKWSKETAEYELHAFDVQPVPMPAATLRLTGQKEEIFDKWIHAALFWDWKPALTQ